MLPCIPYLVRWFAITVTYKGERPLPPGEGGRRPGEGGIPTISSDLPHPRFAHPLPEGEGSCLHIRHRNYKYHYLGETFLAASSASRACAPLTTFIKP